VEDLTSTSHELCSLHLKTVMIDVGCLTVSSASVSRDREDRVSHC